MVLVMELPNAFWGVTVTEGKRYTQKLTGAVHLSMAALEPSSSSADSAPVSVMIQHDKADFMLCTLSSGKVFQQTLDLNFNEGEEVTFYLKGKGVVHLTGYLLTGDEYDSESDLDFIPGDSFAEAKSDDSFSSDDDVDEGGDNLGGSKKRKKQILDKKSKKAKVEIVDDEDDDDDDEEDGCSWDSSDDDDDEEESDGRYELIDDEAEEEVSYLNSDKDNCDESDMDDDDDEDDEEETPKKKSDKKKPEPAKKHQLAPGGLSKKEKKEKKHNERTVDSTSASKQESTSTETGEKKKKKKKKNKNKKENAENSAQEAGAGSSNEKVPSKPSSKVVQGVTIEDLKVGHGPEAKNGSTVHVYYTGRLINGKLFDMKNSGKPFKFRVGKKEVIKGWDVGLQGMKVGGKRKLVIPANMGYGSQNVGTIPPNSTLQFEVELKAVN